MLTFEWKFDPGQIVMTRGIDILMKNNPMTFQLFVYNSLERHMEGDWGDLEEEDKKDNDFALKTATAHMVSAYIYHKDQKDEQKIWVITEWDRSVTTILLPEEY